MLLLKEAAWIFSIMAANPSKEVRALYSPDPYTYVFGKSMEEVVDFFGESVKMPKEVYPVVDFPEDKKWGEQTLNTIEQQIDNQNLRSLIIQEFVRRELNARKELGVRALLKLKELKDALCKDQQQIDELEILLEKAFSENNWLALKRFLECSDD